MANNIIINQALDALRASLPVGDVVSTTAVKVNCTNENDVTVKIMNVDFVCHVRENITKATLNPTLATMQTMNNDKQQIYQAGIGFQRTGYHYVRGNAHRCHLRMVHRHRIHCGKQDPGGESGCGIGVQQRFHRMEKGERYD